MEGVDLMGMYLIGALLLLALFFALSKLKAGNEIYSRFGLKESTYTLVSSDLGGKKSTIKLSRFGINGIADAVFKANAGKEIIVGEFKSRKFRGAVRLCEFYQVLLYMGHLAERYPDHVIKGRLAYADSTQGVYFDPQVYEALIGMRTEMLQALGTRRVPNSTPLHKRMKVAGANKHLKLTSAM